jgi:hypothetical protein
MLHGYVQQMYKFHTRNYPSKVEMPQILPPTGTAKRFGDWWGLRERRKRETALKFRPLKWPQMLLNLTVIGK